MQAVISLCWVVMDEYGLEVTGVFKSEAAARAVARTKLDALVHNGRWTQDRQYSEVLERMVVECVYHGWEVE